MKSILRLLPYIIVFIAAIYVPADSDLGWHLKYGEYFFKTGSILKENTFSSMMPDYKWVNHSWGTDIITYGVFSLFGFWGLSTLGALIITLIFYFFSKAAKLTLWDQTLLFPLILLFENSVNLISFRAQLISILFLGIEYYLLTDYAESKSKKIWLLLPLFLVWANIHGQFIFGLGVIPLFFFGLWFEEIKKLKIFGFIFIGIILTTLINPFGVGVYKETINHFLNPWGKYIAEWVAFTELSSFWWKHILFGILIFSGLTTLFFNQKLKKFLPEILTALFLYFMPFLARRYAWSFYYLSLPLLQSLSQLFVPPKKYIKNLSAILLFITLITVIILKMDILTTPMDWKEYCNITSCSQKGAEFLVNNNLHKGGKLFTIYNWGGFLIWNFPEIKPTIDGRMVFWKDEKGYSAFAEFYPIEQDLVNIDKTKYNVAFVSPQKNVYQRLEKLVKAGKWDKVYEDEISGIFVRK